MKKEEKSKDENHSIFSFFPSFFEKYHHHFSAEDKDHLLILLGKLIHSLEGVEHLLEPQTKNHLETMKKEFDTNALYKKARTVGRKVTKAHAKINSIPKNKNSDKIQVYNTELITQLSRFRGRLWKEIRTAEKNENSKKIEAAEEHIKKLIEHIKSLMGIVQSIDTNKSKAA